MPEANPIHDEPILRPAWGDQTIAGFGQIMLWCLDQPTWLRHLASLALFAAGFTLARFGGPLLTDAPLLVLLPGIMVATLLLGAAAYPMAVLSVVAWRVVLLDAPLTWSGPATRDSVAAGMLLLAGIAVVRLLIAELRRRPGRVLVAVERGAARGRSSRTAQATRLADAFDVSTRKRAKDAGRESAARFRASFEQAPVGIAHLDLGGRILLANDRYCEIVGYRREDLLRRRSQDLVLPADRDRGWANWEALIEGKAERYSVDRRQLQSSGATVWVQAITSPVRDDGGRLAYLMLVLVDISERKRSASAEVSSSPPRGGETILAAEDNTPLRGIMVQQLSGLGYHMLEAGDGAAALAIIEQRIADGMPLDLLLTDVAMPGGMTGLDLARAARQRVRGLRVLIASANADEAPGEVTSLSVPVLCKPFRSLELARAVRDALDG